MGNKLARRSSFAITILIIALLVSIYLETRPRMAVGREPLTDIQNIQSLRNQFNQDAALYSFPLQSRLIRPSSTANRTSASRVRNPSFSIPPARYVSTVSVNVKYFLEYA